MTSFNPSVSFHCRLTLQFFSNNYLAAPDHLHLCVLQPTAESRASVQLFSGVLNIGPVYCYNHRYVYKLSSDTTFELSLEILTTNLFCK